MELEELDKRCDEIESKNADFVNIVSNILEELDEKGLDMEKKNTELVKSISGILEEVEKEYRALEKRNADIVKVLISIIDELDKSRSGTKEGSHWKKSFLEKLDISPSFGEELGLKR